MNATASFDSGTDLWTYEYTIDNTLGDVPINEVVLWTIKSFHPKIVTNPTGWTTFWATAGMVALPPVNMDGRFWVLHNVPGIAPGASTVFAVSTPRSPMLTIPGQPTFFTCCASDGTVVFDERGIPYQLPVAFGYGPVPSPTPTPEPSTVLLAGAALGMLPWRFRRNAGR